MRKAGSNTRYVVPLLLSMGLAGQVVAAESQGKVIIDDGLAPETFDQAMDKHTGRAENAADTIAQQSTTVGGSGRPSQEDDCD